MFTHYDQESVKPTPWEKFIFVSKYLQIVSSLFLNLNICLFLYLSRNFSINAQHLQQIICMVSPLQST